MSGEVTDVGQCAGVLGRVKPHRFRDGRTHHPGSHGLCPRCRELTLRLIRAEAAEQRRAALNTATLHSE